MVIFRGVVSGVWVGVVWLRSVAQVYRSGSAKRLYGGCGGCKAHNPSSNRILKARLA